MASWSGWDRLREPEPEQPSSSGSLPIPPLPTVRPMATPVMDLKRETANFYNFSPEARTELYDTPTLVNYRGYDNKPEREPQGVYMSSGHSSGVSNPDDPYTYPEGDYKLMVQEPHGRNRQTSYGRLGGSYESSSLSSNTLAHEFGHLWDSEKMPSYLQDEWRDGGWTEAPQWQLPYRGAQSFKYHDPGDKFMDYYRTGKMDQGSWDTMASEGYAQAVQQSRAPWTQIPPEFRDKYFAGLFNDSAPTWQPQPYASDTFSTDSWVPQRQVQSYYEDGSPIYTRRFPERASFPSLSDYDPLYLGPDTNGRWG